MVAVCGFGGSLDYGVACGFAFGYAGTSRSIFARDDIPSGSAQCLYVFLSDQVSKHRRFAADTLLTALQNSCIFLNGYEVMNDGGCRCARTLSY